MPAHMLNPFVDTFPRHVVRGFNKGYKSVATTGAIAVLTSCLIFERGSFVWVQREHDRGERQGDGGDGLAWNKPQAERKFGRIVSECTKKRGGAFQNLCGRVKLFL